jgi:predicted MPP superfamily phosphohydrolase
VIVATFACAFVAVADLALQPLYVRGVGQGWISHANALAGALSMPGLMLVVLPGLRQGNHTLPVVWVTMQLVNFAMYTLGVAMLLSLCQGAARKLRRGRTPNVPRDDGRSVSRRALLGGAAAALAGGAAASYPMSVATRRFEITRRTIAIRDLPPGLSGLRIVQLSDIHHGPWIPLSHVNHIVATTNALEPDLILLTGDYVHRSPRYCVPVVAELAKLRARVGILGVLGNHDWWEDGPLLQREFARAGVPLIDNARKILTPDRRLVDEAREGLCIAGVGDLYTDAQDYEGALGGLPGAMPALLLSHNPDVAEAADLLNGEHRVDLMLSGHTHGGQVYVPGLGTPIVPSRFGQKYASGLVEGPACRVYVSRGLGHTVLPMRVGVRPELAVIQLTRV